MTATSIVNEVNQVATSRLTSLNSPDTLILGIGNISRGDDGLGWTFLYSLENDANFKGVIEYRYLLLVEDASLITQFKNVIFVDASHEELKDGFSFNRVLPGREFEFSTHIIPPTSILYLADELYESKPRAWTLAISGKQWGLGKSMSEEALNNLKEATNFFKEMLGLSGD